MTNQREVIPAGANIHVDHILPIKEITRIENFEKLPRDIQNQILKDPENLQPMVASANCSKGCRIEADGNGWETWKDSQISRDYKDYLGRKQDEFRNKVTKMIREHKGYRK